MGQTLSTREWLILALFFAAAPFVHFYVQVYWSMLSMPFLPSVASHLRTTLWLVAEDLVGAAIAAILLAAPLAWLMPKFPLLLASVIATATVAVALFTSQGSLSGLVAILTSVELAAFFVFCWVVASVVVNYMRRHAHAT
jgi:hypothetical protein